MAKIGFICTGNMGATVAKLVAKNGEGEEIFLSNRSVEKAEALAQEISATVSDNETIARRCQLIFLGVKPQMMGEVLSQIAPILEEREDRLTLVSMAAGLTMARIQELSKGYYPVIRIMPNLPLVVGAGVVEYCATEGCFSLEEFSRLLSGAGILDLIPESQMDAASAISGCGPAFCAMFLEALADGGVLCGLSRTQALSYAVQTMIGTGEMILQEGIHPALLKDGVCSPGGSTIRGVTALEQGGFRGTTITAVQKAFEGSKALGKPLT